LAITPIFNFLGEKMKYLLLTLALLFLGCGTQEMKLDGMNGVSDVSLNAPTFEFGTEGAKDYFTKRNMTGEDLQNFQNKVASDTDKGYVDQKEKVVATDKKASGYMNDRNMTGEDLQNFENDTVSDTDKGYVNSRDKVDSGYMNNKDKVSASKNKAAGYTGDRNITGDAFSKQFDDYEGKVRRKGEITKGYTTDRLDQMRDPNREEREELKRLQNQAEQERLDRLAAEKLADERMANSESRLSAEEAQSSAHTVLISQLELEAELRAILVDGEFRDVDSDMDSLRSDMEEADMELMDALNTAKGEIEVAIAAMLEDLNQANTDQDTVLATAISNLNTAISEGDAESVSLAEAALQEAVGILNQANTDQDTVLATELAQLRVEIGQAEQAAKLYADNQDDILESELRSKIRRVKRRLRYKIRRLDSRMSRRLNSAVHSLEHRISRSEQSAKAYADRQDGALRSSLVAMIDRLQLDVDTNQAASELADQLLRSYVDSENGRQDQALASAVSTLELYIDSENSYQNDVAYQVLLLAKGYIDGADLALSNRIDDLQTDLDAQNTSLLQAIDDAEQAANDYADANDSDTVYDDTQVQADIESISGAGGSIETLTALIQANSDAIAALESNPDLVCSVTVSTVAISERYKYYHGGGGHYHWSTRTRILSIPTVTCPSPLASDDD